MQKELKKQLEEIAKTYNAEASFTENKFYFLFDESVANKDGTEITDEGAKLEKEVMNLGFDGAILQSEFEDVDFSSLAFSID